MQPLFVTEFELDPGQVESSPDEDEFQEIVEKIVGEFQQASAGSHNLVSDSYFDAFTRSDRWPSWPPVFFIYLFRMKSYRIVQNKILRNK